jgi:hypothetical protein
MHGSQLIHFASFVTSFIEVLTLPIHTLGRINLNTHESEAGNEAPIISPW